MVIINTFYNCLYYYAKLVTAPKQLGFPSPQVKALAAVVAEKGDYIEDEQRMKQHDPLMW